MGDMMKEFDKLLNPQSNLDPEDDEQEETRATLIDKADIGDIDDDVNDGKKRRRGGPSIIDLLNEDPRYKGKIISREDLDDDEHVPQLDDDDDVDADDDDDVDADDDDDVDAEADDEADDEDIDSDEFGASDDVMKNLMKNLMNNGGDDDDDSDDDGGGAGSLEDDEEIDSDEADGYEVDEDGAKSGGGMKLFSSGQVVDKAARQAATKRQLSLADGCMERRIKLQKIVNPANRLPRPGNFELFMARPDPDIKKAHTDANKAVDELQAVMMELCQLQMEQCQGMAVDNPPTDMSSEKSVDQVLAKRNEAIRKHRQTSLKFWYDKTRLAGTSINKNFDSLERPTNDQIDHILADRDRLMKRTQLKRSVYQVVGEEAAASGEHDAHLQDVNVEAFDDSDFYQQQIRQLIESKTVGKATSGGGGDSNEIEMTRQWLKLQKLQTKSKKKVDTKASKGRKIRYHIHPKLVSFMAPCDKSTWTDGKINQISRLMFGKPGV